MSMFFKISLFMSIIIISMLLMIPLSNAIIFSSIYYLGNNYLGKKINDTRIEIIQSTRETSRKFKSSEFQAMNETSLTA